MEGNLPELTQQAGGNLGLEPRSLGRGSHQNTFTSDTATCPQEPLAMLKGLIALSAQLQVTLPLSSRSPLWSAQMFARLAYS